MLAGKETVASCGQPSNAELPIDSMLAGKETVVSCGQPSNAELPITLIPSSIVTLLMFAHPEKARSLIHSKFPGKIKSLISVLFIYKCPAPLSRLQ